MCMHIHMHTRMNSLPIVEYFICLYSLLNCSFTLLSLQQCSQLGSFQYVQLIKKRSGFKTSFPENMAELTTVSLMFNIPTFKTVDFPLHITVPAICG